MNNTIYGFNQQAKRNNGMGKVNPQVKLEIKEFVYHTYPDAYTKVTGTEYSRENDDTCITLISGLIECGLATIDSIKAGAETFLLLNSQQHKEIWYFLNSAFVRIHVVSGGKAD
ncbi:MAG: hypothetical protein E7572_05150 [Ruminococcaceae bacterium]|nr:hypothetical protein [Oscillospiraceae bacterium]